MNFILVKPDFFKLFKRQSLKIVKTHSNNLSAKADELFDVFDHFVGLALKRLTLPL